ncbi:GspH/FimT family pseudopilin [Dyella sp.]|jgi:type IV fimbrial biogenesis protein FimT|uniref:GspH/FimT family pseudopilin n=1 Tax=Dyella sp. TaxID=1869338 RepID=UPI002D7A15D0|nr:GspH/FimT family pseudopilin [Dyella sp.]HET6433061.1 GspH/FimT family pseudopilin [Dyella sp.]
MSPSRQQRGFTVVELMVAVAVLAVLTAIALPNFRDFMRRNAVTSHTNEILGDLRYARQTATTDLSVVSICASANPSAASPSCTTDGDYAKGWIIYKAPTAGATFAAGAGFELLRVAQPMTNVSLLADVTTPVSFTQRGSAPGGAVSFLICAKSSSEAVGQSTPKVPGQQLQVMASGRASTAALATAGSDAAATALCQ